jgi:hypothetical protein
MKTIKILFLCLIVDSLFTSCAEPKTFKDKTGKEFTAEPFGWANENSRKNDTVVYEINVGNVILDVLFCETAIVPVVLTGCQFYEPVRLKNVSEANQKTD